MTRIVLLLAVTAMAICASGEERRLADLKIEYESSAVSHNTITGEPITNVGRYILQVASGVSYFYDPQTYFIDSLENDPQGKAMLRRVEEECYREWMDTGKEPFQLLKEKGLLRESRYKCLKNFADRNITVWNRSMGDRYRYEVDMDDLVWELADSVTTISGYECQMAIADYHGRRWIAWFAPEVAVQDGPWQLCGLPGLILDAVTADGSYRFKATAFQTCREALKDPFEDDRYFKTTRVAFLKMRDYSNRNRSA